VGTQPMEAERKFFVRAVEGKRVIIGLRKEFGECKAVSGAFALETKREYTIHDTKG